MVLSLPAAGQSRNPASRPLRGTDVQIHVLQNTDQEEIFLDVFQSLKMCVGFETVKSWF